MTTETNVKVDPTTLTSAALEAKRKHIATEAQTMLSDARQKANTAGHNDPYLILSQDESWNLYKGHMTDLDIVESEVQRRAELDPANGEARIKAALGGSAWSQQSQLASLLGFQVASGPDAVTIGDAFAKSDVYQRHFEKTSGFSVMQDPLDFSFQLPGFSAKRDTRGGLKALVTSNSAVGGPFVMPYFDMEPELSSRPTPDIIDMVSRVGVDTDTIYWILQSARSTSATAVGEATNSTGVSGTKPEATITYDRKTAPVETIAVVAAVTERELADASQISAIINQDLLDDLRIQLGAQILTGNGTAPNLTGILNAGIQTVANSTAFDNALDAMLRAQTVIQTANEPAPDGYVLNPLDWEPMRTAKASTSGNYFGGSPFTPAAPFLWNLPVAVTNQLTVNTGLCGAFKRACRLYERDGVTIRVGWVNDDLYRNIVRVRAEFRAGFVVRRPSAIARVTGI
ncbi:MAG: phage major capsid protein [Ardenticatenales bacterium]